MASRESCTVCYNGAEAAPVIEIADLTVRAGGRAIVSGFSLSVPRGSKAVISGPSGSGKTTVLRAVMGFVEPLAGEVRIDGLRLDARSVWQARRLMGYVPQELDLTVTGRGERATALDVLLRPFAYKAAAGLQFDVERARALCLALDLPSDVLDQDVALLSGGEKRRLALASALLLERPVLVADELTAGLDAGRTERVLEVLAGRGGLTVLVASHDPALLGFADTVARLVPREEAVSP
jgi:ABC-type multidrug transport system ATPase subunit